MVKVKFTIPEGTKNCRVAAGKPLVSFVLRETDGNDEEVAAGRAKAKGGNATATEEAIRLSLVEVNGDALDPVAPYEGFDGWSSKARSFAIAAWRSLNAVNEKEADSFLALAVDCSA